MKKISLHIEHIKNQVLELEEEFQEENGYLLEFTWNSEDNIGELKGNITGLLYFASSILDLANSQVAGKHIHFDSASGFADGSDGIIISKEQ